MFQSLFGKVSAPKRETATESCPFPVPLRAGELAAGILVILLASLLILPQAAPVPMWAYENLERLPLDDFFSTSRQFASTTCVVALVLSIALLDMKRRRYLFLLLIALVLSAGTNEIIKQITGRARPEFSVLTDAKHLARLEKFIHEHPGTPVRAERKDQWLLLKPHRPFFRGEFDSFPSGHALAAFVLAAFLIAMYPRGRWIWIILAVGCALARVRFRRHFPEDVIVGSALGWLIARWVFSWHWPLRYAEWIERKLCN